MATFMTLVNFTEQGARGIKESPKRAAGIVKAAERVGLTVRDIFWTLGAYDGVVIFDAPDEESATSFMLGVAALGNVRPQTLRVFSREEMESIIARMEP